MIWFIIFIDRIDRNRKWKRESIGTIEAARFRKYRQKMELETIKIHESYISKVKE